MDGVELTRLSRAERELFRRHRVGFIFQAFRLFERLNVLDNVSTPLALAGRSRKDQIELSRSILESLGLQDRCRSLPGELSGGEQQRVAIARALVHAPSMVLADEPTAALDTRAGTEIGRLLSRLARHDSRMIIVASHDERLREFVDRELIIDDGKIYDA